IGSTPAPSSSESFKDSDYFFENGDCVFRAEGCMFKLHKLILSRDSESMFPSMFSLPQSAADLNAMDPITVEDSAKDFRALCWALYALPPEIQAQNEAGADIGRLVAVANLSNKYVLPSFESWALNMVLIHSRPAGRDYLQECPQNMLDAIYDAAVGGARRDLSGLVEEKWLARLKCGKLELKYALDFGETRGMMKFLGKAYYQQAMQMQDLVPTVGEVTDFSQSNLTPPQLHRLLSGYCSLSLMCEKLRKTGLPDICLDNVRRYSHRDWKILVLDTEPLSILKKLQTKPTQESCPCGRQLFEKIISDDHFRLTKEC
ncbi:hypothetical protein C8R46DRAFT_363381, partial [Mycena filopes]